MSAGSFPTTSPAKFGRSVVFTHGSGDLAFISALLCTYSHFAYELWPNRTRLPELDQEAIKVQPLPIACFSDDSGDFGTGANGGHVVRHVDRDFPKIS
jgi:hypothetical protein